MNYSQSHHQQFDFPNEDTTHLFEAILELKSINECESFFRDICTIPELKSLSERWKIALLIWKGYPYRTIIRETGASSTTIARVSHWLQYGNGGYRRMCRHFCGKQQEKEDNAGALKPVLAQNVIAHWSTP